MQTWEYQRIPEQALNEWGKAGWRVVQGSMSTLTVQDAHGPRQQDYWLIERETTA